MDDTSLITRVKSGDMAAARSLYDAHAGRVYRLVYRITGERALAEDCVQDTFIRVFQRLGDFRGESAIGTWIGRIATNVALNALRSAKRHWKREVELDVVNAPALESAAAIAKEGPEADPHLKAKLTVAIKDLPDRYRMVFMMYDVEGYSHAEIGETLGITEGASKVRLNRARARLREVLSEFADWRD